MKRKNINKLTSDQMENLYSMLIGPEEDRKLALGMLNNRDLTDKETEKNVQKLVDRYINNLYPEVKVLRLLNSVKDVTSILNALQFKLDKEWKRKRREEGLE